MPAVGLGTFGSDHVPHEKVAEAVKTAVALGYRHIDCASVYGNEQHIGRSLEEIFKGGIRREELWITSKLWNDKHDEEDVIASCEKSLADLGLVRHIGTSNMTVPKMKLVLRDARIRPVVNEMELHPYLQQPQLFRFLKEHGIEPVGYSPVGSPGRPERDRTPRAERWAGHSQGN